MTSAAILDDVQDADTTHALWREAGVPSTINVAMALTLLGRVALDRLHAVGVPAATVSSIHQAYNRVGLEMCAGQYADLKSEQELPNLDECWTIAAAKTACFAAWACWAGAQLGQTQTHTSAYSEFGRHYGLLHQLVNDLYGVFGVNGKLDVAQGKSIPLAYGFAVAPPEQRHKLTMAQKAIRDNPDCVYEVRQLLLKLGLAEYLFVETESHYHLALNALSDAKGNAEFVHQLEQLINRLRLAVRLYLG